MRIISGTFKGRPIPFKNRQFGNARVTPDFLKEAAFNSMGPNLSGLRVLDPFSGSGQIGLEAVSRGALVWMNERDKKRHRFIQMMVSDWHLTDQVSLTNQDWRKLISDLTLDGSDLFDIVYVDPPYGAVSAEGVPESQECLKRISELGLVGRGCTAYVQHSHRIELPANIGDFGLTRSRRYGNSLLSKFHTS